MKNSIGSNVVFTLFGESHGEFVGGVIDGIPSGIKIDNDFIRKQIKKRSSNNNLSTSRNEKDEYKIISGVFNGYTTGTPLTVIIANSDIKSKDYDKIKYIPRPSHADYTNHIKYFGFEDYRGGGHSSGRLSVAIVVIGAICMLALKEKNIHILSHIKKLYNIEDEEFSYNNINEYIEKLNNSYIPLLDENKRQEIEKLILKVKEEGDSIGGILESIVLNLPVGLGDPLFDSLEGCISKALFGIGGIKGVEFGAGFDFSNLKGSSANDEFRFDNNKIITLTNNSGGINGGISNGMPLIVKTAIKPTSSIFKNQKSVNMQTNENVDLLISGRHDPCIMLRVRIVIESIISIVLMDLLVTRYGQNWSDVK